MIKKSKFLFIHHGLVIPIHLLLIVLSAITFNNLSSVIQWLYTFIFAFLHALVFVYGFKIFKSWRDKKIFFQSLYYRYFPDVPYDLFFALVVPFSLSLNYVLLVEESIWNLSSFFILIVHQIIALISYNWILINIDNGKYMDIRAQINPLKTKIKASQKEVLHDMISPHFLFNSLNTLTSIVPESKGKAILFTSELAYLYEFILLNNNRELITVEEEINVLNRYIYLLKSRFEDNLQVQIDLPKPILLLPIPTLTLQNLVENAIKHNVISKKHTLNIDIKFENDFIIVQNPINLKSSTETSTGLGLEYIYKQYNKYFNDTVYIENDGEFFTVKLPTNSVNNIL